MIDIQTLTTADILRTAAGLAGLGTIVYAWAIEPYSIEVTEREIGIHDLPDSLDGLRICHLTDLHIGGYRRIERALARTLSSLEVDICVICGDLLCGAEGIKHFGHVLSHLRTRYGIYAVYGNGEHDPWTPGVPLAEELEAQGVRMLINQQARLTVNSSEVLLGGVDDPFLGYDDPETALSGAESASLRILLAHAPDIVKDLGAQLPDLILAGHTHGGQICFPFIGPIWLHSRHPRLGICDGYYGPETLSQIAGRDLGRTQMYVCRGIGGSGIRARFLCKPEVALLTLRRQDH